MTDVASSISQGRTNQEIENEIDEAEIDFLFSPSERKRKKNS